MSEVVNTKAVDIKAIRIDGGTQPRAAISESAWREYAAFLEAGVLLPPIDVFFDGVDYWLADGFHRFFAAKSLERTRITVNLHPGTRRDAVLFSVGANHGHGLQRTTSDKRKAVSTLLMDAEWATWADREIARRCGVGHQMVGELRASLRPSLAESSSEKPIERTYTTKHGTEATMHVEKIGRSQKPPAALPDRSPEAVQKRLERIRKMAGEGHSAAQIADAVDIGEATCRSIIKREGIDLPAQRATGKAHRHDSDRIVERMVMDAENLTADVNLIEFATLDRDRLGEWADSLIASKKALDSFIRRLVKEQQKNGQAA